MVRLIDVQTLATLLSIKKKTLYDWVYRGFIPYYKVGKRLVRFDYDEIIKWLDDKKHTNSEHA